MSRIETAKAAGMFVNPVLVSHCPQTDVRIATLHAHYPRFIHCFHQETEFLSQINDEFPEWRKYDSIVALGAKIAQYENGDLSFVLPIGSIKRPSDGSLVVHKRRSFEMAVTPEHRMFSLRRTTGNVFLPHTDTAKDWLGDTGFVQVDWLHQSGRPEISFDNWSASVGGEDAIRVGWS